MNRLQCLIRLARALDYNRDPDPEHWKTINGAKVHLDKNGNYDGGAGGKFNGSHHYGGPDWKQKTALMNQLTNALRGGVTQKQAQGNQTGNTSAQNVAFEATRGGANGDTIEIQKEIEEWTKKRDRLQALQKDKEKKYKECRKLEKLVNAGKLDVDVFNERLIDYQNAVDLFKSTAPSLKSEIEQHRVILAAKGVPFTSKAWSNIETAIATSNITVKELPPKKLKTPLTRDEIWRKISGGDQTKDGSCASVALAYVANACGYDVLDFRGGASEKLFHSLSVIRNIGLLPGVKSFEPQGRTVGDVVSALENLPIGKEYYFVTGGHAAIVRRTQNDIQYLEMQHPYHSGWTTLGKDHFTVEQKLFWRFKYGKPKTWDGMLFMDVDSFKNCKELEKLAGYFNTKANQQKKGAAGYVK